VSLPRSCCWAIRSAPPPFRASSRRRSSSFRTSRIGSRPAAIRLI